MCDRFVERLLAAVLAGFVLVACQAAPNSTQSGTLPSETVSQQAVPAETFSGYGSDATRVLESTLFDSAGYWYTCGRGCGGANRDWGADSLTYVSYLRWQTHADSTLPTIFKALVATAETYHTCTSSPSCELSDVPEWDSISDSREYQVTNDSVALSKAEAAYAYVAHASYFALGACKDIRYQHPLGGGGGLKTLETDSNAVKAALLLYGETHSARYLSDAETVYASIRRRFLDPRMPLYTVYVIDNGHTCTQVPRRFYGSVNGNMIWNSLSLYRITHDTTYLSAATATTHAVATELADGRGVYADLQAENDIVEPLVEAMYDMAVIQGNGEAQAWIVNNARFALLQDRASNGFYGRFFDGPAPTWNVTAWQTNGGLALAVAAAALDSPGTADAVTWNKAHFVTDTITTLPSPVITFHGSGIAVIGAIGDRCCEPGHATVILDGSETVDQSGIWQNKSSSGLRIPNAVLFAWRWASTGTHTIQFGPGVYNAKEGGPYLDAVGYYVLP